MVELVRLKSELKRQWVVWLVLFFSGGMKTLVNQVEQPFARSLVVCDVPVNASEYSGSALCGDRLKVLDTGFTISQRGQAQECAAMLTSLTLVAIIAGAFGRKPVVLMGLTGTLISVGLFIVATSSPDWGRRLFAFGQGMQGFYPVDYIQGMIVLDMSKQMGGDGESTFQLAQYLGTVGNLVFMMGFGNAVQLMELTCYGTVWISIFFFNALVLLFSVLKFPETLSHKTPLVIPAHEHHDKAHANGTKEGKEKESNGATKEVNGKEADSDKKAESEEDEEGAIAKVWHEVYSYGSIFTDYRARRYLLCRFCEGCFTTPFLAALMPVQLMAYHHWSQSNLVVFFFAMQVSAILCIPVYGKLNDLMGFENAYKFGIFAQNVLFASMCLGICVPDIGDKILVTAAFMANLFSGWQGMRGYVDSRFVDQEHVNRFVNAQWVEGYLQGMIIPPLYATLFNPFGKTFFDRATPNIIMVLALIANTLVVFGLIYKMGDGTEGFGVTLQQLDRGSTSIRRLFKILKTHRPDLGKPEPGSSQPQPEMTQELWEEIGLKEIFWGKDIAELGGPYWNQDHMGMGLNQLNTGPHMMASILDKCDEAVAVAEKWAGLSKGATEPSKDGKKKA